MRIKPKKSLGQNFLIDKNIRNKIIKSLLLENDDIVLEIGSGRGELTELIAESVDKVIALEVDKRLSEALVGLSNATPNITVINQDILKLDLEALNKSLRLIKRFKVFGNIPYYISSPIIEHLLFFRSTIDTIFITVQKEFAERIVACPGSKDFGSFSCFVQYYAHPKIIFDISKNCFRPVPKVTSSFLELKIREVPAVSVQDETRFFKVVRGAFGQRRKTLRNSLEGLVSEKKLEAFFTESKNKKTVRPEELSLKDFALLSNL
ncbi:MAG: 16S rRNA (adenine(1518)-N(6)/adenine(1519)-N(6))-dimethyltransferase RsmA [Candidatus Omnitrophica bacterium]|nr:16S rRNA (adenine(1518)-N(6)/adenine(1519)-N(6))-dimethyltransferase RsmA [Candidatus Omnitrophota bacterium]